MITEDISPDAPNWQKKTWIIVPHIRLDVLQWNIKAVTQEEAEAYVRKNIRKHIQVTMETTR